MKKIPVNKKIWRKIHQIKREQNFNSFSETMEWIFNSQSDSKEEIAQEAQGADHEKLLQDLLGEEIWHYIQELMFSHHLDISGVLRHLLSCHSLLEKEEPHRKLEGKEVLEEIYDHIQQLQPSQKLKEKSASSEASTVDIAPVSEERDHTDGTCKTEWLCCPVCYSIKPLIVEVDPAGHPLKKHEDGIEYKMVDDVLQRRFSGPGDDYLPFQVRYGNNVNIEESMAISTLRYLDPKLHDHILKTLENAYFQFGGRKL